MEFLYSLLALGVMNTINAIGGIFSDNDQNDAYKKEIERRKEEQTNKLDLMNLEFKDAEDKANRDADRSDAISTMGEKTSAADANAQINAQNLQRIADAYQWNYQAQNIGQNKGAALANTAASGVRTSSVNNAIQMDADMGEQQLQLMEDQARAGYDYNLDGILNALAENNFQIQMNRTDAYDLRAAYMPGGSEREKFDLQYKMQDKAYQDNIDDLQAASDDLGNGWKATGRFIKRMFGVENAGAAAQIGQTIADYGGLNNYLKGMTNSFKQVRSQRSFRAQAINEGRLKNSFTWFK